MIDLDNLKKQCAYDGKPQQWQYGFDICFRELHLEISQLKAELQAVRDSRIEFVEYMQKVESGEFVLVPREPTDAMIKHAYGTYEGATILPYSFYKAMIEAARED